MAKGITIGVAADTRQFSQAVSRGVVEPLEDVSTALDDLAKDSDQAGDKLTNSAKTSGKALDQLGKDGDKAGDKLETSLRSAQKQADKTGDEFRSLSNIIDRESKSAGRSIDKNLADGTRDANSSVVSFKDEAKQNFAEVASSFDGSIEGAVDGVQGTLGGLATAIGGPVGLAFGGIGLAAGAAFTIIQQGAEDSKQRVSDMYSDMIDSGKKFVSDSYISEAIQAIQNDAEGAISSYANAQEIAAQTGANLSDVLRGLAGDTDAQAKVEAARVQALQAAQAEQENYIKKNGEESAAIEYNVSTLDLLSKAFDKTNAEKDTAAEKARIYAQAMDGVASSTGNASGSIDVFKQKLAELPPNKSVRLDLDDADFARKIGLIEGRTIQVNVEGNVTRIGNQVW